jgi:hypothetical protein
MCSKSNPIVVFALDLMSTYEGKIMPQTHFSRVRTMIDVTALESAQDVRPTLRK